MAKNIHPIFNKIINREAKEHLLNQHAKVLWMTGLSGSGKSTLAQGLEAKLHAEGILTKLLDGDNLRTGLNKDLGFSESERTENIRRVAETAKLFVDNGTTTICSFVSPTAKIREQATKIIGAKDFLEVYVNATFATCAERDVKGLYAKALKGEIKNFTGLDAPFEPPTNPFLVLDTEKLTVDEALAHLYEEVIKVIKS